MENIYETLRSPRGWNILILSKSLHLLNDQLDSQSASYFPRVCGCCCIMQTCPFWSTQAVSSLRKRAATFTLEFVKAERLVGQFEHTSGQADLLITSTLKKGG